MSKRWLGILKEIAVCSGAVSIVLAITSVVLAYVQALIFAGGNTSLASYLVNEVGIVWFWSGSLMLLIKVVLLNIGVVLVPYLIVIKAYKRDFDLLFATHIAILSFTLLLMITCYSAAEIFVAIILAFLWYRRLRKMDKYKVPAKTQFNVLAKSLLIGMIVTSAMLLSPMASFMTGILTLDDHQGKRVILVSDAGSHVLVKDKSSGKFDTIPAHKVVEFNICSDGNYSWVFQTIPAIVSNNTSIKNCSE